MLCTRTDMHTERENKLQLGLGRLCILNIYMGMVFILKFVK